MSSAYPETRCSRVLAIASNLLQGRGRVRAYFYSGWAFLIPYLAVYLVYYWQKWPANPVNLVDGGQLPVTGDRSPSTVLLLPIPPLLYVYWAFHAIHVVLAAFALRSWYRDEQHVTMSKVPTADIHRQIAYRSGSASRPAPFASSLLFLRSMVSAATPWTLLALIFYIPGIYLEWPSDPWEHLRRINEWRILDQVTTHSSWMKSSYFLPYSLTGRATDLGLLSWLNVYYTAVGLLLCWQYYRLARAVGLSERASFIFVLLNTLSFGNNVFSFYRYYGLSSSIFAQLGTVALIRIALEAMRAGNHANPLSAASRINTFSWKKLLSLAACAGLLLLFTAFNHAQGLGLVALCLIAVGVWWCIDRYRYQGLGAVIVLAAIGSTLFVWLWPRSTNIENLRVRGWLNLWYGFDLISPSSLAWNAMLQVLGGLGVLNMLCGVWLLRRNHPVGWLTLMPWIALQLPFVSMPLAQLIVSHSGEQNILIVHRLFFSIAAGLAITVAVQKILFALQGSTLITHHSTAGFVGFALLVVGLATAVSAPMERPIYNRTWQTLARIPDDQQMEPVLAGIDASNHLLTHKDRDTSVLTTSPTGFILDTQHVRDVVEISRLFSAQSWTPTGDVIIGLRYLSATPVAKPAVGLLLEPSTFYSTRSIAGLLSGHWLAQESALTTTGTQELLEAAKRAGFQATPHPRGAPKVYFLDRK